ncbi:DUF3341 domain-containing protein [Paludibaculum fermentans]|uniref:DUF3341 domain-containing protein n=1 Tax=Paludibaculum fermentans TaxID=1473598 RepID=A0A7S7NP86_PALFE|nr:DUF3341 domain-containing protein [Paludibaculum fermentans]QOY87266.1 DUF3341 domain-containing protein [Paludibaculum fermentans]
MASKNMAVMATYVSLNDAENALNLLRRAGFRSTDHSLLLSINEGTKDLVHVKSSKAPEGAVAGFAAGAFVGAVIAWVLAGGSIHVPYLDGYLAADVVLVVLAGMSIGAVIGGLVGTIAGWVIPEYETRRCGGRRRRGAILLSVHCDSKQWRNQAVSLLRTSGADDIGCVREAKADFASTDKPMPRNVEHESIV